MPNFVGGYISEGFKKAVRSKNIVAVRSRFFTLIVRQPSGSEIRAYVDYCLNNGLNKNDLYMPGPDETFKTSPSEWNIEYWNKLGSKLQTKFTEERIEHMIEVANKLFPEPQTSTEEGWGKKKAPQDNNKLIVAIIIAIIIAIISWLRKK